MNIFKLEPMNESLPNAVVHSRSSQHVKASSVTVTVPSNNRQGLIVTWAGARLEYAQHVSPNIKIDHQPLKRQSTVVKALLGSAHVMNSLLVHLMK